MEHQHLWKSFDTSDPKEPFVQIVLGQINNNVWVVIMPQNTMPIM